MGLNVYKRHANDDVTLLASTDLEASQWRLESESRPTQSWLPVTAVVMDSSLNWSTPDLSRWEGLCRGNVTSVREAFPEASDTIPAGLPFAVMWNVSRWVYDTQRHRFRFIDPHGSTYEFQHDWSESEYSFG